MNATLLSYRRTVPRRTRDPALSSCISRQHVCNAYTDSEAFSKPLPEGSPHQLCFTCSQVRSVASRSSGGDKHAGYQIRHTSFSVTPQRADGAFLAHRPPPVRCIGTAAGPVEVAGNPPRPSNSMWPCPGLQMCSSGGPCNWPLMHPLPCFSGTPAP
jgi:hypothetical protein